MKIVQYTEAFYRTLRLVGRCRKNDGTFAGSFILDLSKFDTFFPAAASAG